MPLLTELDKEELRAVVADALDVPVEEVTDTASFVDDLGVDSLLTLEVMVSIEQTYGVKLEEGELQTMTTFEHAWKLMQSKQRDA
ncbi:acyl carrier protein [Streptomyces gobiensis]|uniref:acyl carrier protein n=1 Tax=Streptomyces gobiensis TaxID=2875706 RepID=UPI001E48B8EA|nr:acyl carrier protein [Streptomyces gobiensis]UGY94207.1 acyl carrier protein [Streptomyces gobiensis]